MNKAEKKKILDSDRFKKYFDKVKKLGFRPDCLFYTRHTNFIPDGKPPCDICGSRELIHPIGRYVCFDFEGENKTEIYFCGNCLNELESLGIECDMN